MKNILILGADGYLGWPTSMYLSNKNYNVVATDNFYKKKIIKKLKINSLFKTPSLEKKCKIWKLKTKKKIIFENIDLCDFKKFNLFFKKIQKKLGKINTVIHFAEQPSAPYSMISPYTSNDTIYNNLIGTNNLINTIRELNPETHIVKLGTMGEYGTPNIVIEEGWLKIIHKGRSDKFLFPRQASSIYHTSKIMDTDLLWFACRNWKIKVTDLMQGPVYGISTKESQIDKNLTIDFFYDEIFGTVINRFVTQAAIGHPLTIYGKGGQTRGYIHIKDTLKCIEKAIENPPTRGHMNIYNQISETFSINEIAKKIKLAASNLSLNVKVKNIKNPRNEKEKHFYNPVYSKLKKLGFESTKLSPEILTEMIKKVLINKNKIIKKNILRNISW